MASARPASPPVFEKDRHIRYWLRCLKTFLPGAYTSNDSNRMMLAYFTLSSLDLLGVLYDKTTEAERAGYVDWIYRCQHPAGGFRGFPGTDFGDGLRTEANAHWDPAHLAGTFLALCSLVILGDGLERVRRRECLEWLARLQLADGSLGEMLGTGGTPEGGSDVRFCHFGAAVRWILRPGGDDGTVQDIDTDKFASFVMSSKTYDGGFSTAPYHEGHAGLTYCGTGALAFVDKLSTSPSKPLSATGKGDDGPEFVQGLLHWLVSRQTTMTDPEDEEDEEDPADEQSSTLESVPPAPSQLPEWETHGAGFCGRCNKLADTCYCFWVSGSLGIMKKVHLINFNANRRFLLGKTQHIVGGFGKSPGDPPDLLHSYLGLAALATMKEPGLRTLDPMLCVSLAAREHLESLPWRRSPREPGGAVEKGEQAGLVVDGAAETL